MSEKIMKRIQAGISVTDSDQSLRFEIVQIIFTRLIAEYVRVPFLLVKNTADFVKSIDIPHETAPADHLPKVQLVLFAFTDDKRDFFSTIVFAKFVSSDCSI